MPFFNETFFKNTAKMKQSVYHRQMYSLHNVTGLGHVDAEFRHIKV